jgi:hypothetical protein
VLATSRRDCSTRPTCRCLCLSALATSAPPGPAASRRRVSTARRPHPYVSSPAASTPDQAMNDEANTPVWQLLRFRPGQPVFLGLHPSWQFNGGQPGLRDKRHRSSHMRRARRCNSAYGLVSNVQQSSATCSNAFIHNTPPSPYSNIIPDPQRKIASPACLRRSYCCSAAALATTVLRHEERSFNLSDCTASSPFC